LLTSRRTPLVTVLAGAAALVAGACSGGSKAATPTTTSTVAATRFTSVVRAERMGPTGVESPDWKTAKNRVMPSTSSSYTTSAWLSPVCGRASAWLSILTTSAGRFCVAGSVTGRPVNT